MERAELTDLERGWYIDLNNGERISLGFVYRQLGNEEDLTLSDLKECRAWKNGLIAETEKARLIKLFDERGKLIWD